ncbi:MAG: chemotaxis protein chel, partial [Acetobacteraceae bacterium]|nr:chemotaxis protein chel [Acetobacteraceae bacterium]
MTTVLSSPDASQATSLSPAQIAKTWKAAQDFEAMALAELLQPIFNTVSTSGSVFGGGEGEEAFKPM